MRLRDETWRLSRLGLIKEDETTKYRKYWRISSSKDSKTLIQDYLNQYQAKKRGRNEIRTKDVYYVPIRQLERYFFCSEVSFSSSIPRASHLR